MLQRDAVWATRARAGWWGGESLGKPTVGKRASPVAPFCPQIEQRIEPAKRAAHSVSKRLQACLQGQCGSEMDKRVKKLPLMALSTTMAESFKELDTESSLGKALEMGCCIQSSLAKILAEFEITLERDVLQPLNKLSEEELPIILKRKKTLQRLISDWNTIKSRYGAHCGQEARASRHPGWETEEDDCSGEQISKCHARFLWKSSTAMGHIHIMSHEGSSQEWGLGTVLQGVSVSLAECPPT